MSPAPRKKSPPPPSGRLEDIVEEAQTLTRSLAEATDEVYHQVAEQATAHPYRTVGAAAGIGFVLAGGLTPRVAGLFVSLGSKWLIHQITDQFVPRS